MSRVPHSCASWPRRTRLGRELRERVWNCAGQGVIRACIRGTIGPWYEGLWGCAAARAPWGVFPIREIGVDQTGTELLHKGGVAASWFWGWTRARGTQSGYDDIEAPVPHARVRQAAAVSGGFAKGGGSEGANPAYEAAYDAHHGTNAAIGRCQSRGAVPAAGLHRSWTCQTVAFRVALLELAVP